MTTERQIDKDKALAIIDAIAGPLKPGLQKDALQSVHDWIKNRHDDATKLTREEREIRIAELLAKARGDL